jgi:hypothetical protein
VIGILLHLFSIHLILAKDGYAYSNGLTDHHMFNSDQSPKSAEITVAASTQFLFNVENRLVFCIIGLFLEK